MAAAVRREPVELTDTIFAVSSGRPPAAIAVIRISGPHAFTAARTLAGSLPPHRRAGLRTLRRDGVALDAALVLCFPAPATATGEELVELHCHGGRAVVAAVEAALAAMPGLRPAEPGEFTRRSLTNGRIDLIEAEGLADLLEAETEAQRVAALAAAEGRLSGQVRGWLDRIAVLSAQVEALLDYAEEDDVAGDVHALGAVRAGMAALREEIGKALAAPSMERLRSGVRVVLAGPPNAGKSTLLNLLVEREAAIVTPIAGTTRDRIEASVVRQGLPFTIVDTAGLTETPDVVEAIGVRRAQQAITEADLLVWLGDDPPPDGEALWLHPRADLPERSGIPAGRHLAVSAHDHTSIDRLWIELVRRSSALLANAGDLPVMHDHQRDRCHDACHAMQDSADALILAEGLAGARRSLATVLGLDATEVMLDALFGRFCLGK